MKSAALDLGIGILIGLFCGLLIGQARERAMYKDLAEAKLQVEAAQKIVAEAKKTVAEADKKNKDWEITTKEAQDLAETAVQQWNQCLGYLRQAMRGGGKRM